MAYNSDAKMMTVMFFGGGPRKEPAAPAPAGYTGPLDLASGAVVAYGVRALSAAMLGQNIFRLRRDSDDAEMDFASDATTGDAPVTDIATWLDEANGFIVTWYDQSGNSFDATQATAGKQASYVASAQNSKPAFQFVNASLQKLVGPQSGSLSGTVTFSSATKGAAYFYLEATDGSGALSDLVTASNAEIYTDDATNLASAIYTGLNQDAYHVYDAVVATGVHSLRIDGTLATPDSTDDQGTVGASSDLGAVVTMTGADSFFLECIAFDGSVSDADRTLVRQNQGTYYNISLS